MDSSVNFKRVGRVRRGWELTKSSWRVLVLDKELLVLPILGFIVNAVVMSATVAAAFGIVFGLLSAGVGVSHLHITHAADGGRSVSGSISGLPFLALAILLYLVLTIVSNYFVGAIIFGANERFRGGDPTVRSSLAGVRRRLGPIAAFSLLSATVGLMLQALQDRLSSAGKIVAVLGGVAWNIATIFAVPIIILEDERLGPIDATKQSARMVRKIWGEGLIVQAGIGVVSLLTFLGYIVLVAIVGWVVGAVHAPSAVVVPLAVAGLLVLTGLFILFETLSAIAKAALYHFATTGEVPETFSKELLHASMIVKKARRTFA